MSGCSGDGAAPAPACGSGRPARLRRKGRRIGCSKKSWSACSTRYNFKQHATARAPHNGTATRQREARSKHAASQSEARQKQRSGARTANRHTRPSCGCRACPSRAPCPSRACAECSPPASADRHRNTRIRGHTNSMRQRTAAAKVPASNNTEDLRDGTGSEPIEIPDTAHSERGHSSEAANLQLDVFARGPAEVAVAAQRRNATREQRSNRARAGKPTRAAVPQTKTRPQTQRGVRHASVATRATAMQDTDKEKRWGTRSTARGRARAMSKTGANSAALTRCICAWRRGCRSAPAGSR